MSKYIYILRNFWEIGSTDEHAIDGIECPPNDFAGLKSGKYALAVAKRKGPVAILTSPHSDNEGETCITFYYNIPVKVIIASNYRQPSSDIKIKKIGLAKLVNIRIFILIFVEKSLS